VKAIKVCTLARPREINTDRYAFFVYDQYAGDLHSVISKMAFFREDEPIKRVSLSFS
jgi:hypothetical protein